MKRRDITGQKFGRLLAIGQVARRGNHAMWKCRCDCGNERTVQLSNLVTGNSPSCGCISRERMFKHGLSGGNHTKSRAYVSWSMMRDRCGNPNNPEHHNYGGRGISVCVEWDDFMAFYRDMGERPEGLSLHRINNELGYFKENCCWADDQTQLANRRADGCYPRANYNPISQPQIANAA